MIASLHGKLLEAEPPAVVIECAGVGYEVWIPLNDFAVLPPLGEPLLLHTHLVVRADAQLLFGFRRREERKLFDVLIGISGIGPKSALGLMSTLAPQDLAAAIEGDDVRAICRAPGIGSKSAQRIVLELRGNAVLMGLGMGLAATAPAVQQAQQALVALGYAPNKARLALAAIDHAGLDVAQLVAAAAQQLSGMKQAQPKGK